MLTATPHTFLAGHVLIEGTCPITGKRTAETARCSLAHAQAVIVSSEEPSAQGIAWIAEDRFKAAQAIRKDRSAKRAWMASGEMPWSRQEWRWERENQAKAKRKMAKGA